MGLVNLNKFNDINKSVLKKPLDVNSYLLIKVSSEPVQSKIDYRPSKKHLKIAIATTIK